MNADELMALAKTIAAKYPFRPFQPASAVGYEARLIEDKTDREFMQWLDDGLHLDVTIMEIVK